MIGVLNQIATLIRKVLFLILVILFRLFLPRRDDVWLYGENSGRLSFDNGYHFFRYCCNVRDGCFFLVRDDYSHLLPADSKNCIRYGSVRHAYYLSVARVIFYTHTYRDVLYIPIYRLFSGSRVFVALRHGVTALKKFHSNYAKKRNDMNLMVAVSEKERSLLSESVDIQSARISITGFARFDSLENVGDTPPIEVRRILFMPTWRDWISTDSFVDSSLYQRTISLLNNRKLHQFLVRQNIKLTFLMHINMRQYTDKFVRSGSTNIEIIEANTVCLQDHIKLNDLLITDYSSICWDFLYQSKPVLFYQFDVDDYLENRGSYIDLKNPETFFGHVFYEEDEFVSELVRIASQPYRLSSKDVCLRNEWITHFDNNNCQRIYNAVLEF